jgi:GTPase SAR1 family protein
MGGTGKFYRDFYYCYNLILLCYNITSRKSFSNLNMYIEKDIGRFLGKIKIVLCGTKTDLSSERVVSYEEEKEFANKYNFDFYELSAKTNENINEVFNISINQFIN